MSKENMDIVRQGLEHFLKTGDFLDEGIAPEYVWDMSTFRGWPEQQTYEGLDGARDFIRAWVDAWEDWTIELKDLHDAGDKVVAVMHQHGRSKGTGLEVDMTFAQVFTLRDGSYVRMQMYADPAEALEATGLSE